MMVIGFLAAVFIIRCLSKDITTNPQYITNAALYSLIAGVVGARIFYVVHHISEFQNNSPLSIFAIWQGGLELLGGVILAITVIFFYLWYHKLPIRRYLDILAIGLMLALAFGRIGCFLNGCCFGKPTDLPWAVRFPYGSFAYVSQANANKDRNRGQVQLQLPLDYFSYVDNDGMRRLKPYKELTEEQKFEVTQGKYRCLRVHPTQLYSSAAGAVLCLILYLFWKRSRKAIKSDSLWKPFTRPGSTFAMMFVVYGCTRFFMEFLRDDNPFEFSSWAVYKGGTVSQNIGIYMTVFGLILLLILQRTKHESRNNV